MATKIIITRKMNFHFESGINIEESATSRIISGTLLREGISKNGRLYSIEEMVKISKQATGIPIYYDVDSKNRHKKGEPIGKIVRAHFDEKLKSIKFWAKITNAKIAESVRRGWKVSIGGVAEKAQYILDKFGQLLLKLKNLILTHVQLLSPETESGVEGAEVEDIQESLILDNDLRRIEIAAMVAAVIKKRGIKNVRK